MEASRYYGQDLVVSFTQSQSGAAEEDISPTKTWARNIDIIGPELERLYFVLQSIFFYSDSQSCMLLQHNNILQPATPHSVNI